MSLKKTYSLSIDKGASDWIRFFSALMVAAHHYSLYALSQLHQADTVYKILSYAGGYLGVAVFFFFSGYGLMESEQRSHLSLKNFLRKRFTKIYLPVLLITAIWMGCYHFFSVNPQISGNQAFTGGGDLIGLLWGFYDGVLWFVKVLIALYVAFYVFSFIRQTNKSAGWIVFALLTICIQIGTSYFLGRHALLSIPFFAIGAFASDFKNKCCGIINIAIIPLVIYPIVAQAFNMHPMVIFNAIVIISLLIIFTRWQFRTACPALISAIAFDVYLVHNKVLMVGRTYTESFSIGEFATYSILAAIGFYCLRQIILENGLKTVFRKHKIISQ